MDPKTTMFKYPKHFHLGKIIKTHGLHGDVVCSFDTDNPAAYAKLKSVFLEVHNTLLPFFIKRIKWNGAEAIVSLDDITSADQAGKLKGADIYLPLEKLPKPRKNEFYWHDLLGSELIEKELGPLGKIQDIIETSGHNLLSFEYQGKEVLLPFVKEFVLEVDLESKIVQVQLPDGLLDIYLAETNTEKDDAFEEEKEE
jgi:16S rRNA processing protein RimM